MSNNNGKPPQKQAARGPDGRFAPGHSFGTDTRFVPGQSGNPGGRPAGCTFPGRWLGALADETENDLRAVLDDQAASASKRAAARLLLDMLDADPTVRRRAFREVADRVEGQAVQRFEHDAPAIFAERPTDEDLRKWREEHMPPTQ